MDNLIRKALLGDKESRIECAEKGIVLPCPLCGSDGSKIKLNFDFETSTAWAECQVCGVTYAIHTFGVEEEEEFYLINDWNTRPAPPIGRCGECEHYNTKLHYCDTLSQESDYRELHYVLMSPNDYCSYFEQKEEE